MHRSSKKLDTIIASTENQTEFFNGIGQKRPFEALILQCPDSGLKQTFPQASWQHKKAGPRVEPACLSRERGQDLFGLAGADPRPFRGALLASKMRARFVEQGSSPDPHTSK